MALGGNVLRQHVVEFIRGTGIVTDGVVDATSLNGPWSWQVPEGVAEISLDGCGAGAGGGGGTATGTRLGGGGGGGCGLQALKVPLSVVPNTTLTIIVGSGGTGGPASDSLFVSGTNGGETSILGVLVSPFTGVLTSGALNKVILVGGSAGEGPPSAGEGGNGGGVYRQGSSATTAVRGSGAGGSGGTNAGTDIRTFGSGSLILFGTGGGGAGHTTASTAGGNGAHGGDGHYLVYLGVTWGSSSRRGNGDTTGTVSRGGGGCGGPSVFATYPKGGHGGEAGTTATGYGAGGGGGGGGANGGNGGDGYVRFTYWSMD